MLLTHVYLVLKRAFISEREVRFLPPSALAGCRAWPHRQEAYTAMSSMQGHFISSKDLFSLSLFKLMEVAPPPRPGLDKPPWQSRKQLSLLSGSCRGIRQPCASPVLGSMVLIKQPGPAARWLPSQTHLKSLTSQK